VGCCIDVYSTCLSDEFDDHPYYGVVAEIAAKYGYSIDEVREVCLIHQRQLSEGRFPGGATEGYVSVLSKIEVALSSCRREAKDE